MRSFTPYQIGYLVTVLLLTAAFAILFPELMLEDVSNQFVLACSVIAVLANPVCELMISKQSKLNFLVDLFFIEIPELVICLTMGWYTIAIITVVFWMPIDIFSYLRWSRHPDQEAEELTVVKRLNWKQDFLVVAAIIAFSVVAGYFIGMIPGAESSYLDALASACGMANGVLLLFPVHRTVVRLDHDLGTVRHFVHHLRGVYHADHCGCHDGQYRIWILQMVPLHPAPTRWR